MDPSLLTLSRDIQSEKPKGRNFHLPDSQARCSRGLRPSLAESALSPTYWGREDDLDIEYSLIFSTKGQLNVGPLSATLAQH